MFLYVIYQLGQLGQPGQKKKMVKNNEKHNEKQ